jgi:cyclopropane-fatty-acyl-phospholipid synthase
MNEGTQILDAGRRDHPWRARLILGLLSRIEHGRLELRLPDGSSAAFGRGDPHGSIRISDWSVFAAAMKRGDIGFAEAYMDGHWQSADPAAALTVFAANRHAIERAIYGGFWGGLAYRLRHLLRGNTRSGSRRNIAAHYDLGNDFYRLWLDPSMTYSSAWFGGDLSGDLEAAQDAKYRRILERLAPRPGERLLEIGCGWGGLAEMAARDYGCEVVGLTLSKEQLAYARERMLRAGVAERVDLRLMDYRDVREAYDHVVSIEMYEAVGERYWRTYFATLARALAPGRSAMIQAITIDERLFERYRTGTDFIQQYIFPGGMLATPARIREEAERAGLEVTQAEPFGADYAETLRRWRHQFTAELPAIHALGYPESFIRMWEFYLAYCEAGFATRCTDVYHFQLSRPR